MSPIRVGMVGLSARAKTSWALNAHLPYLKASNGKYIITALCNSSVSAARAAIETYGLPASTKAYGSPEDLANDQEIDLVVCNTRVDVHYEIIKPSLRNGKSVYCEWPLASNLTDAEELQALAKKHHARTMVGLQGELTPIVLRVKSLIEEEDKIGKVLSSTVVTAGGTRTRDTLSEGLRYFTEKKYGGNVVTIGIGHILDWVELVLGELSSFTSKLSIQRPKIYLLGPNGSVVETVSSDVADHVMIQGTLPSGAPLSFVFRRGPPFKGTPGFLWLIHGEKGEIKVEAASAAMQVSDEGKSIQVHNFETDEVETIEWESKFVELPSPARGVAAMYEAFADETEKYPDFDRAVLRHRQIEEMLKNAEDDRKVA